MDYIACQLIWHSRKQRYYGAGEKIPLDHLDDKAISDLIDAGIVTLADNTPKKKEVTHAPNSIDGAKH